MVCVLFPSGEKEHFGSDRSPGDSHSPQHNCSQHPDQRRVWTHQPADPRVQTPPRGSQTAEVSSALHSSFIYFSLLVPAVFLYITANTVSENMSYLCVVNFSQEYLQRDTVSFSGGLGTGEHRCRWVNVWKATMFLKCILSIRCLWVTWAFSFVKNKLFWLNKCETVFVTVPKVNDNDLTLLLLLPFLNLSLFSLLTHVQRPTTESTAWLMTNWAASSSSLCTASINPPPPASSGALNVLDPPSSNQPAPAAKKLNLTSLMQQQKGRIVVSLRCAIYFV